MNLITGLHIPVKYTHYWVIVILHISRPLFPVSQLASFEKEMSMLILAPSALLSSGIHLPTQNVYFVLLFAM